jgi:hypothetical protein
MRFHTGDEQSTVAEGDVAVWAIEDVAVWTMDDVAVCAMEDVAVCNGGITSKAAARLSPHTRYKLSHEEVKHIQQVDRWLSSKRLPHSN